MNLIYQTFEQAERRFWDSMRNEWEVEKQRILNTLIGSGQDLIDIAPETENLATEGVSMEGRSVMDSMEMAYARQVSTRHVYKQVN